MKVKQRKTKLYIPTKREGKNVILLSANKIPQLEEILPSEEALVTHMQIQHIKVKQDEKYSPEPLIIHIEKEKFGEIFQRFILGSHKLDEVSIKNQCIPLVTAWPAIPICLIYSE